MATYNWKSPTNGSWNNPTLWDTGTTPVVTRDSSNSSFYGSADTTVFNTGSSNAYSISGTASALSLQVAHDTVIFDSLVFFNDRGADGSLALPTISITNGAAVLIGPNANITLQQSGSFSYESFGRVTVNNAALIVAGLLWGDGDYLTSVAYTVMGGWDTDSNGATAGSVAGILAGTAGLPDHLIKPLQDRTRSALFGWDNSRISQLAERTYRLALPRC